MHINTYILDARFLIIIARMRKENIKTQHINKIRGFCKGQEDQRDKPYNVCVCRRMEYI